MRAFLATIVIVLGSFIVFHDCRRPERQTCGQLDNDCAIVASEAAARLSATGAWTKILCIEYDTILQKRFKHDVVVWLPSTATNLQAFDQFFFHGSVELGISRKDADVLGRFICQRQNVKFIGAHFVQ